MSNAFRDSLLGANAVIAQDRGRLGKTLYTRKPSGDPIEVVGFRNAEAEALGIASEIQRRHAEGSSWQDMAILYRSNALSRGFEESLMRAHIPYVLVGDVGFYQRAEIKDTLALLRLAATLDNVQGDEAFRRVINVPARGFGPKALDAIEQGGCFPAGITPASPGDGRLAAQGAQRGSRVRRRRAWCRARSGGDRG